MSTPNAEAWEALGYLSGLHPGLAVDPDQPMKMAEAIFEHVQAEKAALQERIDSLQRSVQQLRRDLIDEQREARRDAIAAAAEARWQERQGEDYGSY